MLPRHNSDRGDFEEGSLEEGAGAAEGGGGCRRREISLVALFEVHHTKRHGFIAAHTTLLLREYGAAYWEAATKLVEVGVQEGYDAYPVAFLYRHALETVIKSILVESAPIHGTSDEAVFNRGHDLAKQLQDLHLVFDKFSVLEIDGYRFDELKTVVGEWGAYDPDSFAFRYFVKKDGQTPSSSQMSSQSQEGKFRFNLMRFAETMDSALDYLFNAKKRIDKERFGGFE